MERATQATKIWASPVIVGSVVGAAIWLGTVWAFTPAVLAGENAPCPREFVALTLKAIVVSTTKLYGSPINEAIGMMQYRFETTAALLPSQSVVFSLKTPAELAIYTV